MNFKAQRITKTYQQVNCGSPEVVFPLLCPVREADWLEDWEYTMIYSESGLAERGCIFSTKFNQDKSTYWYISVYDIESKNIEFVRITDKEVAVKINIHLDDNYDGTTTSTISYEYTALTEKQNDWIEKESDKYFTEMMVEWEKSINHYIITGEKLIAKK